MFTKNDLISWELQQTDYPQIDADTPNYEPRGCQRGISASWYPYSPLRPKYPYVRGRLLEYYREEREAGKDPVEAYAAVVEDEERAAAYKNARGKGGWRRVDWEEATELVAAAQLYTILEYGPDRMAAFSPIPAMSMVSWISGERLAGLLGAPILSFYEYYHDLPHVMPMIWGDQTDVAESADWYQSKYWIVAGTNLPMTRTPDAHFASEFKYDGGKLVSMSPDYSDITKFADTWVPATAGTDGAFLMACIHVILSEHFVEERTPYFESYVEQYTNLPFLVALDGDAGDDAARPGRLVRASDVPGLDGLENPDGKPILLDADEEVVVPQGTIGGRWNDEEDWNLEQVDVRTGEAYEPTLSLYNGADGGSTRVSFADFTDTFDVAVGNTPDGGRTAESVHREVPVRTLETEDGEVLVTTAFDLLLAQLGVSRDGLDGDYPAGYDDDSVPFTPAWQAAETGVDEDLAVQIAREWAETAAETEGKCMFITGSGVLHWYHGGSLTQRAMAIMGIITGCMGKQGGGFHNYVGTEKVRPYAAVPFLGSASDWHEETRLQNTTSWMYFHD
ncbi:MAG: molybdopterin-dependent oxidoreductase, partial [Halodesulfurarchaeum sp.]